MARRAQNRRQFVRRPVDFWAQAVIHEDCLRQVNPVGGPRIAAHLRDISLGGTFAVVPTYLPRGTRVRVEFAANEHVPAGSIDARVVSVRMTDHEPHYGLGLQFDDPEGRAFLYIETLPEAEPVAQDKPRPHVGAPAGDRPAWMTSLAERGTVSPELLDAALRESDGNLEQAAEWLINNGCVTERELALVLAEAAGLCYVDLSDFRLNLGNRDLLTEPLCRTHRIFPLFALERIVTLAVAQPLDLAVLDQIRLHSGCEIDMVLVPPREIQRLIEWAYRLGEQPEDTAETDRTVAWEEVIKDVSDAPAVRLVNVLLDQAVSMGASDIHVEPEEASLRIRFRVDGVLREVPAPPRSFLPALVSRVKVLARLDIAETRKPQDGHFKITVGRDEVEVRVSTLPTADGEAVVMRLLRAGSRLLSLEELGMAPECLRQFERLIHLPFGMLLVTGPTGSGKSTTLYSALTRLDRVRQSIITLEDPVEVRLPRVRQVPVNPKAGLTFQSGLRAILRQDPDCIMVGEIRDPETASIALQAALTGHLMLSTLHTNTAGAAPARLIDMGVPDFLTASALVGVLAQRLCRRLCTHCAEPLERVSDEMRLLFGDALPQGNLKKAVGCKRCGNTGYAGRVGIFELLVITDDIRRAILARERERAYVRLARQNGMQLLIEDGLQKVADGLTTLEEVVRVAGQFDPADLRPAGLRFRTVAEAPGAVTAGSS